MAPVGPKLNWLPMNPLRMTVPLVLVLASLLLVSCGPDKPVSKGQRIYVSNCAMCHTTDPARGGPRGPALAGAPLNLLEKKLLEGRYPPGYEPRRPTAMMPTFPHIKPYIPELAEYLGNP